MRKLLRWLFGKKEVSVNPESPTTQSDPDKYAGFDIEYHPHSKRYFPRYKRKYLYWWMTTQKYTLEGSIIGCVYEKSLKRAREHIDRYLELQGVETIIFKVTDSCL